MIQYDISVIIVSLLEIFENFSLILVFSVNPAAAGGQVVAGGLTRCSKCSIHFSTQKKGLFMHVLKKGYFLQNYYNYLIKFTFKNNNFSFAIEQKKEFCNQC